MSGRQALARLLTIVAMMIMAMSGGQVSAQFLGDDRDDEQATDGVFVSESTDLEITFTDDWDLVSSEIYEGPTDEELIQFESDAGMLVIAFAGAEGAEESRDLILEEFTSGIEDITYIDEGSGRGFAWSLLSGSGTYIYLEVEDAYVDDFQLVTLFMGAERDFLDGYELAQNTVEIDGGPILLEHDVDDLDELLGGGTTRGSDEPEDSTRGSLEDEEETTRGTDEDEDDTTRGGRGDDEDTTRGSLDDDDETSAGNERETGRDNRSDDETAQAGDEYVFELDDLEVVVTGDVSINSSDVQEGSFEQILLLGNGSIGAVSMIVNEVDGPTTLSGFMSGFVSEMDDAEEIDSGEDNGVAWTLYTADLGAGEMYVYATVQEDYLVDWHLLELVAVPADVFEDEFVTFQESVEVDGSQMFESTDVDDLIDILEGF